jgi:hypothetical protein
VIFAGLANKIYKTTEVRVERTKLENISTKHGNFDVLSAKIEMPV